MIGIGVDFGTSNSAAAWFDGEAVHMVPLEADDPVMPTATHLDRELQTSTGREAVDQYVAENQGRIVELVPEVIAYSALVVSEGSAENPGSAETASSAVYGQPVTDLSLPGRLFRGVKRLLGNPDIKRLMVFDHPFRVVALITPVLLRIRKAIESVKPETGEVHVGHPVNFEGHDQHRNDLALARLKEACGHAGLTGLHFCPEPVAATMSYLHAQNITEGRALTVDFGGGTLDLSIIAIDDGDLQVEATAGVPVGGDHIDQLIFRKMIFPLLGKGERWTRTTVGRLIESDFPFEEFEDCLLNWAVTYTLNQNRYRAKVQDCIAAGGPASEKFRRLDDLITHNYAYVVFQAIRTAKAELSDVNETIIDVPELDVAISFSRRDLELLLVDVLATLDQQVATVLERGGMREADISLVIRTGVSSQSGRCGICLRADSRARLSSMTRSRASRQVLRLRVIAALHSVARRGADTLIPVL